MYNFLKLRRIWEIFYKIYIYGYSASAINEHRHRLQSIENHKHMFSCFFQLVSEYHEVVKQKEVYRTHHFVYM